MAKGSIHSSEADIALSITGFAGDGDEPGLVHFACARRDGYVVHREEHFGDIGRGPIRLKCLRVGLQMMSEALADRKSVVEGKSVSVRVDLGGRRIIKKKKTK